MSCFLESIFLVFCRCQSIFGVVQKYPTPLIPVSKYAKSTTWGIICQSKAMVEKKQQHGNVYEFLAVSVTVNNDQPWSIEF